MIKSTLSCMVLLMCTMLAFAAESEKSLAKASLSFLKKNHFAKYISLPWENDINAKFNNSTQNILNFKPVIPFHLNASYDLIVRTIVPIYTRSPLPANAGSVNGLGDINPTFFISPNFVDTWILGIGPTLFLPTTSNSEYIASSQWSIGPELAAIAIFDHWMYGTLVYNVYAKKAGTNKIDANQFSFQYLLAYTFDNGWSVSTNPNITANWQNEPKQRWIVPFGLGVGKAFYIGKQAMSLSTNAYYNTIRPTNGPKWQLQLALEWLFPS